MLIPPLTSRRSNRKLIVPACVEGFCRFVRVFITRNIARTLLEDDLLTLI